MFGLQTFDVLDHRPLCCQASPFDLCLCLADENWRMSPHCYNLCPSNIFKKLSCLVLLSVEGGSVLCRVNLLLINYQKVFF